MQLAAADEQRVQRHMAQLRACGGDYSRLHAGLLAKRLAWWDEHGGASLRLAGPALPDPPGPYRAGTDVRGPGLPRQAYTLLLLRYMGLDPAEVPVVYEDERLIVWRSYNFCPMLEACLRMGLDTRQVCRAASESSVQALIARLDPRLRFARSYSHGLRPYAPYCEESIALPGSASGLEENL